jgi:hypothetical protein
MRPTSSKGTIVSMAIIASAAATLLHEGLGHGVTAALRGDIVTELTSNHLSSEIPDRLVEAGGTIVNLLVGFVALLISPRMQRSNLRYFFWILAALNLLPGAGYFLFSGVIGFGDWNEVIRGLPHHALLRVAMTLFGAVFYVFCVRLLAFSLRPFVGTLHDYNTLGRVPYLAACIFSCIAGAFDPLGIKLLLVSTMPAAFGGSSGLLWADRFLAGQPQNERPLLVERAVGWWIAAAVLGTAYIAILGPGIQFKH